MSTIRKDMWLWVPLDVAATPANGEAMVDQTWGYHPDYGVLFFRSGGQLSPQCNRDPRVADHMIGRVWPEGAEAKAIPVVFRRSCERYLADMVSSDNSALEK